MGERQYEDPASVRKLHHKMLSTLLGRCIYTDMVSDNPLDYKSKKLPEVQFFAATSMDFRGLQRG